MAWTLHGIGLVGPDATLMGPPHVRRIGQRAGCPLCGCKTVYEIEIPVYPAIAGPTCEVAIYMGCPACAWGSPVTIVTLLQHQHVMKMLAGKKIQSR